METPEMTWFSVALGQMSSQEVLIRTGFWAKVVTMNSARLTALPITLMGVEATTSAS